MANDNLHSYYTSLISDIKSNQEKAITKIDGLIALIDDLQTALDEASGDNIDQIKSDLLKYSTKFKGAKKLIKQRLTNIESKAHVFDDLLTSYLNKKGIHEEYRGKVTWGLLGYGSTRYLRCIENVYIGNDDGLIHIAYSIYKEEKLWWGADVNKYLLESNSEVIDEMKGLV